jgi:hypothetical protein
MVHSSSYLVNFDQGTDMLGTGELAPQTPYSSRHQDLALALLVEAFSNGARVAQRMKTRYNDSRLYGQHYIVRFQPQRTG